MSKRRVEQQHQIALIDWVKLTLPEFRDDINLASFGENIGPRRMATLKKMGLTPSYPDLVVYLARGGYHGLLIEMKKPNGRLTKDQKDNHARLLSNGYQVHTCYSWDEARQRIEEYLSH